MSTWLVTGELKSWLCINSCGGFGVSLDLSALIFPCFEMGIMLTYSVQYHTRGYWGLVNGVKGLQIKRTLGLIECSWKSLGQATLSWGLRVWMGPLETDILNKSLYQHRIVFVPGTKGGWVLSTFYRCGNRGTQTLGPGFLKCGLCVLQHWATQLKAHGPQFSKLFKYMPNFK